MQVIKVSQKHDRESWLDLRRGVITGTSAKNVAPPKRGTGIPSGIYEILAEKVAIAKDGEPERDRGLRLEDEAILLTQASYGLDLNLDPGMWLSDDGKIGVSPDAAENIDKPTYAAEAKCLDTKNHLQAILNDFNAKLQPNYNPIESLKINSKSDFSPQAIQYFVVNPHLQTLYFTLFDDRVVLDNVMHYVIVIKREDVEEYIESQEAYEYDAIEKVNKMIAQLKLVNRKK